MNNDLKQQIRVLMITSEYPTEDKPAGVPFIARQVKFLRRAGIDVDVFHFNGGKRLRNYIRAWWSLRKYMAGKQFDIMHAQWGHSAALALPKNLPWVITFRGNDLEGIIGKEGKPTVLGKILQTVSKTTGRLADAVIVVSESLGGHLKRNDFKVIPSGLDFETFRLVPKKEARKTLNLDSDKKLILFAASTIDNPRKRFELATSVVELVKKQFDAELIVATKVPHEMIPIYMNACDSLLLTSVHEGSPNVVKEALACNLPIVSVDVGDVKERIKDIEGCFVCEDDSKETIAANLENVLRTNKRINGRRSVEDLDENEITRRVIEIYQNILLQKQKKTKVLPTHTNKGEAKTSRI